MVVIGAGDAGVVKGGGILQLAINFDPLARQPACMETFPHQFVSIVIGALVLEIGVLEVRHAEVRLVLEPRTDLAANVPRIM